ncbi:hypothetical protein ACVOMV_23270 [Mesorhizobium atlanticum]
MVKDLIPRQNIAVHLATRQLAGLAGSQAGILPALKPSHIGYTYRIRPRWRRHTDEHQDGRKRGVVQLIRSIADS